MSQEGKTRAQLIAEATGKKPNNGNNSGLWKKLLVIILPIVLIGAGVFIFLQNNKEADFGTAVIAPQGITKDAGYMVGQDGKLTTEAKNSKGEAVDKVTVYLDYNCIHCKTFEQETDPQLSELREKGEIVVEYKTVAFLDGNSVSNYSSRAANATACLVNDNSDLFLKYNTKLFESQASEENNGKELANAGLNKAAVELGANDLTACIKDGKHRAWVADVTKQAVDSGITGTPTVLVNDVKWDPNLEPDLMAHIAKVTKK